MKSLPPHKRTALRRAAEMRLKERSATSPPSSEADLLRLQHELQVHQIELEMQNEELRAAQTEIDAGLKRYKDLFDFAPVGYFNFTADGTVRLVNLTGARLVGIERTQLLGRRFGLLLLESDRRTFSDFLTRVFATETGQTCELTLVVDGRTPIVVVLEAKFFPDNQECRAALIDITERKRGEAALLESAERLRIAVKASNVGLWDWNLRTNQAIFSREWKRQLGYEEHEIENDYREWNTRIHPNDLAPALSKVKAYLERLTPIYENEFRLRHKDGSYRWIIARGALLFDDNGCATHFIGTHFDLTDRKEAEELLRMRDRAIHAVTQGILITDPTQPGNPIIYVNLGFELITGYSMAESLGRSCQFLQGKDTDPEMVSRIRTAIHTESACTVVVLNYRKDGTPFWNELSISPVRDEKGQLTHFVGVQVDVTDRQSLEEQLRQSQKMDAAGQLAGGIAHDFDNLLTIIKGYTELLLQGKSPTEPSWEPLRAIQKASGRAADLTKQLLTFARREIVSAELLDLNAVVVETLKLLERLIGEDIDLDTSLDPQLWRVWADRGQISQIVMNLAINARDAMPNGGNILIRTQNIELHNPDVLSHAHVPADAYILLSVTDNGSGMTDDVRARIFEPFFTTESFGKGTGLGLATVHGIVIQSGGHIEVSSELGKGTAFKIYLPQSNNVPHLTQRKPELPLPHSGTETILLVEDEEDLRILARGILTHYGYKVLDAANGNEALQVSAEYPDPIQLLVTDVVMPGPNGPRTAKQIRTLRPRIRVLLLSGYVDDAETRRIVPHDNMSFLQKPFSPLELVLKVREVLDLQS